MKTKLTFNYYNKEYVMDISDNEYILSLIKNEINTCKEPNITCPNDDADDKIRRFVDEVLKLQTFYHGTGHAEKIFIYKESDNGKNAEKLHVIHGTFSDEKIQEIIRKIKEESGL